MLLLRLCLVLAILAGIGVIVVSQAVLKPQIQGIIDTRDTNDNARAFERHFGITYPSIIDEDGALLLRFNKTLPPQAIPTTLVIDKDGRMAARALKQLTEEQLRELVRSVLDSGAT